MAQKQSAQDAVSAAMSAIEDALNLSSDGSRVEGAAPAVSAADPALALAKALPAVPPPLKTPAAKEPRKPRRFRVVRRRCRRRQTNPERRRPSGQRRPPAIGPIVQSLRCPLEAGGRTSSPASSLRFGWRFACGTPHCTFPRRSSISPRFALILSRPETLLIALAALGPTIVFFGFAALFGALARRSQELRAATGAIAQAALRFAEPETVAGEQVATLSQAIRREIAMMGDGVERALSRAAELETLVRSEVTTLERAYADNERRIRSLIAEMADQREAILASGGQVRAAVDDAHRGIANDLERIANRSANAYPVSAARRDIARRLLRGGHQRDGPRRLCDRRPDRGAGRATPGIPHRPQRRRRDAARRREQPKRGQDCRAHGRRGSKNPGGRRDPRRRFQRAQRGLINRIGATSATAVEALISNGEAVSSQLAASTEAAANALAAQNGGIIDRIEASSAQAVEAIQLHGDAVATRLTAASDVLAREFGERSDDLVERFEASRRQLSETVFSHGDELAARLSVASERLHETVVVRGQALEETLAGASERLAGALSATTEDARALLDAAGATWSEHFEARHAQLRSYIDEFRGRFERPNRGVRAARG